MRPHALLLDIDGVLYVEDEPVGGAVAAVARLRAEIGSQRERRA